MSPGFSSQWNSSQPAWNTYTFPRASLHYQSHASYTYCAGHPAVSNENLFCSYLNELCGSLGGGGTQGLMVQHPFPAVFMSHASQNSSHLPTLTLKKILELVLDISKCESFMPQYKYIYFYTFSILFPCMKFLLYVRVLVSET